MQLADVMTELEGYGSEQTRKTYSRHGVKEPMFGVSYANLKAMTKKIKKNQLLAVALWETGNHDARILATMMIDPKLLTEAQADIWVRQLGNYAVTGAFAGVVAGSPFIQTKMALWIDDEEEFVSCVGWDLLSHLALGHADLPNEFFTPYLPIIQKEVHTRKNRVRYAMNNALIAIGRRNDALKEQAVAVARIIGKVEVDHGPTYCQTPLAEEYIQRQRPERKKS